jgi:hypothetical protein
MGQRQSGLRSLICFAQNMKAVRLPAAARENTARLMEIFDKASELLERSPYIYGDVEIFETARPNVR